MAPTGRGSLRPYQPSKFQPFIIVCLFVTVIVVGFNFWNLMKKNSLLLVEIGKLQGDFKRTESEKKDCYVQFKEAEEKRKKHEDADHEKEILLEDTRRIVEDLKAEADTLRQNNTKLLSQIASAELFGSRKENKSRSECEQKLEELRLETQSLCDADKEKMQHEATDQLDTMKKQLKLQYQETQQLDQMLQQQKQHPTEQEKKELQPQSNSPPLENNYIQQPGHIQKQRQQQQQPHQQQQEQQQQHEAPLQQQQQQETQREIQEQNQINVQHDQKLPSGQQIERRGQQSDSVGDRKRLRKGQVNGAYRQIRKQSSGLQPKIDRGQGLGEKLDQREQIRSKDTYRLRQGEQQQGERIEPGQREEVQRVEDVQPPKSKQETNDDQQQRGRTQVPSIGEQNQLGQPQRLRQLHKRSDQNATVLAVPRARESATGESASRAPDQPEAENLPKSNNDAADSDAAEHLQKRDDVGEANHLVQTGDSERVDQPVSVRPPDDKLIQNEEDRQNLKRDWQEKNKNPYQPPNSLDAKKPPEGNADV